MAAMTMLACSNSDGSEEDTSSNTNGNTEQPADTTNSKNLVVYFSAQTANANVDGISGATEIIREDGNNYGAAQYLALLIARRTNADTLRIAVEANHYALDYQTMAYGTARNEAQSNARPKLTSRHVDMSQYKNVFIVSTIWWYTLPMPVYSFLDDYDLSGKNVYVATTHAGSGLANAITVIRGAEPNANVSSTGLAERSSQVSSSTGTDVDNWLRRLGFEN